VRQLTRAGRGRSVLYLLIVVVGLGYAIAAGHWGSVVNLLLRLA
jgi:hypothetical protein